MRFRFSIEYWLRPQYLPPVQRAWFSGHAPYGPLDWVVNKGDVWRDRLGHILSYGDVTRICGGPLPQGGPNAKDSYIACLHQHGFSEVVFYHPFRRFWIFQGIETAIFLGLSAILLGVTVWWVRHRAA